MEYDKAAKWLIQHHGDSILRLAGLPPVGMWRALQSELVSPRRLPDGLLEVTFRNAPETDLFLLEIATYPERRVAEQLTAGAMLAFLDTGRLPEMICLVLHPKGKLHVPASRRLTSQRGLARCTLHWRVVRLWELPASELLAADDVGLIPWIPCRP